VEIVYAEIVADVDMCKPIAERFDQLARQVGSSGRRPMFA
jgi:hypothetical protein